MSVLAANSTGSYIEFPDPAYMAYTSVPEELSKADRNALGNLIKERITVKTNIKAEWHGLTAKEKNAVVSATSANTFSMRYLDIFDDTVKYGTFYRGSSPEIKGYGRFEGTTFQYYDVVLEFVEA